MKLKKLYKKIFCIILIIICLIPNISFAATTAGQEMRTQVLYLAGIIDDDNNMNEPISRGEFAKMVVKTSAYKDSVNDVAVSTSFADVLLVSPYASYVRVATEKGYMTSFLGGLFKPDEYLQYKDLIRACLALLGYENADFTGNQMNGRYETFCSLKMNTNIDDKIMTDVVTKKECVNALYNTLKTNKKGGSGAYGPSVFNKMSVNSDGELNASGLIKTKLDGPYLLKRGGEAFNLAIPFDITSANIFINGNSANIDEVMRELNNKGYVIYYYNITTKTIYVYKEGATISSTTAVAKGYVNHIYYSVNDIITPTRVEISNGYYTLGSTEVQFAFSYAGTLHVGDQVIYMYDKSSNDYQDEEGMTTTIGSITEAWLYDTRY